MKKIIVVSITIILLIIVYNILFTEKKPAPFNSILTTKTVYNSNNISIPEKGIFRHSCTLLENKQQEFDEFCKLYKKYNNNNKSPYPDRVIKANNKEFSLYYPMTETVIKIVKSLCVNRTPFYLDQTYCIVVESDNFLNVSIPATSQNKKEGAVIVSYKKMQESQDTKKNYIWILNGKYHPITVSCTKNLYPLLDNSEWNCTGSDCLSRRNL